MCSDFSLKTNVTSQKDVMASANQTPGGYKFAPLVASQQGRANQHKPACFGLSSPWSVDPMLRPSGNPYKYHDDVLFLQPMIPPKRFDISPPLCGMLLRLTEGLDAFRFFFKNHKTSS